MSSAEHRQVGHRSFHMYHSWHSDTLVPPMRLRTTMGGVLKIEYLKDSDEMKILGLGTTYTYHPVTQQCC